MRERPIYDKRRQGVDRPRFCRRQNLYFVCETIAILYADLVDCEAVEQSVAARAA